MKHLVFFDIDGTLLRLPGAGRRAFQRSLKDVFGWDDDIAYINFYGATDLDVLDRIVRRHHGVNTPERTQAFFTRLEETLREEAEAVDPIVYPGVRELLSALSARDDVLTGIVTGNIETCATLKLSAAGLRDRFMLGAFGHEHADRIEIARLALQRALAMYPEGQQPETVALIGDTGSDIAAAKAIGARAVAVATGSHTVEELTAEGADAVFEDVTDLPAVLTALTGPFQTLE